MKTSCLLVLGSALALSAIAHASPVTTTAPDPWGFCPPPGSVSACTTGQGFGSETISVGTSSFATGKNGSGTSASPWYLIVAIPEGTDGAFGDTAPTITGSGFTQVGATLDAGDYLSSSEALYTPNGKKSFTGLQGDASMNASNLFGSNETFAFGSTPSDFEVFVYQFKEAITSNTFYTFDVGGSGLPAGTFLAATDNTGTMGFSTPYTTTGLVCGPTSPNGGPSDCGSTKVPEPSTLLLLGAGLIGLGLAGGRRRRSGR